MNTTPEMTFEFRDEYSTKHDTIKYNAILINCNPERYNKTIAEVIHEASEIIGCKIKHTGTPIFSHYLLVAIDHNPIKRTLEWLKYSYNVPTAN